MSISPGTRARFVYDSYYAMVNNSLIALGWFNAGRQHLPITFSSVELPDDEPIPLNTLVLVDSGITTIDDEIGSQLAEHRWTTYIDLYAESKPFAIDLMNDVKDIVSGRISTIGRTGPVFAVYDYTHATPPVVFYCQIENVIVDRSHNPPPNRPWMKHYYSLAAQLVWSYGDNTD